MKTTVASLSAALLLSTALVGCGTNGNNNAANNPNTNGTHGTRSIGYHPGNSNGTMNNNNPGYHNRTGYNNQNVNNNREHGYNNTNQNHDMVNTHSKDAQRIADKVANMKNVEHASALVTDNDVVVGIDTRDHGVTKNLHSKIRKSLQNKVGGKNVHVSSDPKMYNRIKNTSNSLQTGARKGTNEVSSDVRGIINDLGNAAKRPFENNAH